MGEISAADYSVLDRPNLTIDRLTYPASVTYSGHYNMSLTLRKISESTPYNVSLIVSGSRRENDFDFGNLGADKDILIDFSGEMALHLMDRGCVSAV